MPQLTTERELVCPCCGATLIVDLALGRIVSPLHGGTLAAVQSPVDGILFTLREYPAVYEGSLMARIMAG